MMFWEYALFALTFVGTMTLVAWAYNLIDRWHSTRERIRWSEQTIRELLKQKGILACKDACQDHGHRRCVHIHEDAHAPTDEPEIFAIIERSSNYYLSVKRLHWVLWRECDRYGNNTWHIFLRRC